MSNDTQQQQFISDGLKLIQRLSGASTAQVSAVLTAIQSVVNALRSPAVHITEFQVEARAQWDALIASLQVNDADADAAVAARFDAPSD